MMLPLNVHSVFVTVEDAVRPVRILADFRLFASGGRRSIQLSYSRVCGARIRTRASLLKWNLRADSVSGFTGG